MDSPISDTSTAFDFGPVPMSQSKAYQPLPSMSTEQPLVPPATYHYRREGWFGAVRIWNVSDQSGSNKELSSVTEYQETEHQETCNPFVTCIQSIGGCWQADDEFDEDVNGLGAQNIYANPPSHCIWRTGWSWYTLSERSEDQSELGEDKRVMDFETERWWGTTSVYNLIDDPSRHGVMHRPGGILSWFSIQRTLDDFDGVQYSCKTSWCTGEITLTRLSDGVVIARLSRVNWKLDWGRLGVLDVVEPVSQDLLRLIFSAIYIKYLVDRERERESERQRRRKKSQYITG